MDDKMYIIGWVGTSGFQSWSSHKVLSFAYWDSIKSEALFHSKHVCLMNFLGTVATIMAVIMVVHMQMIWKTYLACWDCVCEFSCILVSVYKAWWRYQSAAIAHPENLTETKLNIHLKNKSSSCQHNYMIMMLKQLKLTETVLPLLLWLEARYACM